MALRRYQHKFLQPLEIDQERVQSSLNSSITATNLTVTNSNVTTETIRKLSTNNFFNSATPDYTPSAETLTVFGDPNVSTGSIATIRVNNVSVNDADAFGGLKLSSSQGNDFIIGKRSVYGTASLQIRNSVGNSLLTMSAGGDLAVTSVTASSYGSVGNYSGLFGQIRVGADQFGNAIKVVNDTNLNIVANNAVYFNVGASTAGNDTGTNVGYFGTNGLYLPSGKGIDFSAGGPDGPSSTNLSEILNDYEQGEFNPLVRGSNGQYLNINSSVATARYIKVGRKVTLFGRIQISSIGSATGTLSIENLPFVANNTGTGQSTYNALPVITHGFSTVTNGTGQVFIELPANTSSGTLFGVRNNDSWLALTTSNVNTGVGAYIYITGSYYTM